MTFKTYMIHSLRIFSVLFFVGMSIDKSFKKLQDYYSIPQSIFYGILQLFVCICISYLLHISTSKTLDHELQVYSPSVVFSSFMMSLQTNMFINFQSLYDIY